ncbi:MAG: AAA family ATPase [Anaerolineales bacterium]
MYRSSDAGETWQKIGDTGLERQSIYNFWVDSSNGTLYGQTNNGLYRSSDAGETWQKIGDTELEGQSIYNFWLDSSNGTLYGQTSNGLYRSSDTGETWRKIGGTGLEGQSISNFLVDSSKGTLYGQINNGLWYRSMNNGETWQEMPSAGLPTVALLVNTVDPNGETLFIYTDGGMFYSLDNGETWREIGGISLGLQAINHLVVDSHKEVLYAQTSSGLYRSPDDGQTWQEIEGTEMMKADFYYFLAIDHSNNTLYTDTNTGFYKSLDDGKTWDEIGKDVFDDRIIITNLVWDDYDGSMYVKATDSQNPYVRDAIYQSRDDGDTWQQLILTRILFVYSHIPSWIPLKNDHSPFMSLLTNNPEEFVFNFLEAQSGELNIYWNGTLVNVPFPQPSPHFNNTWLTVRTWTILWLIPNIYWILTTLIVIKLGFIINEYMKVSRPFDMPIKSILWRTSRPDQYAKPEKIENAWQIWQHQIRDELKRYGSLHEDDLTSVPRLFRSYALWRFYEENDDTLALHLRKNEMKLLTGRYHMNWRHANKQSRAEFGKKAGLSENSRQAVARQATALAGVLGMELGEYYELGPTCAWRVSLPTLRLNIPQYFPLVFIADPEPNERTVSQLVDIVNLSRESSYFSLVIALEPESSDLDIPGRLRRAIDNSPFAHDFVVLSQDNLLDILIARYPERILSKFIGEQVDMSVISPFVVNGPVPTQMFFGRDKEIRQLVEHAGQRNFAIIGNRKIGKTSLLNKVEARLIQQAKVTLLRMDCQSVRNFDDFYTVFELVSGLSLTQKSPEFLADTIRNISKNSDKPLVFMMDELDALLDTEQLKGESLISTWRALANERTCSFIFCGSKVLARQLRDSTTAMFNFPEPIALSYLRREETDEVIARPLETLGIEFDDQSSLLNAVWDLTSGHPNISQFVGRALVTAANQREDRKIYANDVHDLRTNSDFVDFYFDTSWGAATPLEILITLLAPENGFAASEMEYLLAQRGIILTSDALDQALGMLLVYSLFEREGRKYQFVPRSFCELLVLNYEKERIILREKSKIKGGN